MSDKNGSVSADDANDKLTSLYIIIVVSAIFAFVVLMHFICCKACTELDETADENFFLRVLSTDSLTAEQERKFLEKRRKLILKSILQKKAIRRKDSNEIILFHESELRKSSTIDIKDGVVEDEGKIDVVKSTQMDSASSADAEEGDTTRKRTSLEDARKEDIFIESLREWRSSRHGIDNDMSSSLYSPSECAICLTKYKDGDDVCWSQNVKCFHAYHSNCIIEWLLKHNECPMCRRNFLKCDEKRHT